MIVAMAIQKENTSNEILTNLSAQSFRINRYTDIETKGVSTMYVSATEVQISSKIP